MKNKFLEKTIFFLSVIILVEATLQLEQFFYKSTIAKNFVTASANTLFLGGSTLFLEEDKILKGLQEEPELKELRYNFIYDTNFEVNEAIKFINNSKHLAHVKTIFMMAGLQESQEVTKRVSSPQKTPFILPKLLFSYLRTEPKTQTNLNLQLRKSISQNSSDPIIKGSIDQVLQKTFSSVDLSMILPIKELFKRLEAKKNKEHYYDYYIEQLDSLINKYEELFKSNTIQSIQKVFNSVLLQSFLPTKRQKSYTAPIISYFVGLNNSEALLSLEQFDKILFDSEKAKSCQEFKNTYSNNYNLPDLALICFLRFASVKERESQNFKTINFYFMRNSLTIKNILKSKNIKFSPKSQLLGGWLGIQDHIIRDIMNKNYERNQNSNLFYGNIKKFKTMIERHKIKLVLIQYPGVNSPIISDAAKRLNIPLISNSREFLSLIQIEGRSHFFDDQNLGNTGHLNSRGSEIWSRDAVKQIKQYLRLNK